MDVSDFNYDLPAKLIAIHPPKNRGSTRLLVLSKNGKIKHKLYKDFSDYIKPGDVVVLNDTKVIKARLLATNKKGQKRELLLLEDHNNTDFYTRKVMYRGNIVNQELLDVLGAKIRVVSILGDGLAEIDSNENLLELADKSGTVPLPPYMHRDATQEDVSRYQTIFARDPGSVAAPTASLNFTKELQNKIISNGGHVVYLTLHVGLGTFLPIRTNDLESHQMHSEYFEIPRDTIKQISYAKTRGNKIFAVGTTVARTLEYAKTHFAPPLKDGPFTERENVVSGEADIFIYPGYEFKVVDALLTNFHAPKSTVLMLAAAFAAKNSTQSKKGWDNLKNAYHESIKENYSLLSYGDSMLIM